MLRKVNRSALVPYSAEAMFDLVNDVLAYPEFLPWCDKAELHAESATEIEASLHIKKGKLHKVFRTHNSLQRPQLMHLSLLDGPFRVLDGGWRFEAIGDAGCQVSLQLEFEFENRVTDALLGSYFEKVCNSLVDAFTQRASDVYGQA